MDALPPNAGMRRPRQRLGATASNRTVDYLAAAVIAALALAVSPVAIRMLMGRSELTLRSVLLSISFNVFLLLVASAVLARGGARRFFFAAIACTLPFVVLAALETLAGAIHLSDRVAMFQDVSTLEKGSDWGPGKSHLAAEKDGFVLYRPWSGNGVTINALGLRTVPPSPKASGEHRIAVVGSSETWGFRLADDDTIPALLQAALHDHGHGQTSVYNFGIEDATVARELALLKHFKAIYDIDQVVFVAGASDLYREYFAIQGDSLGGSNIGRRIAGFELYRTIERIRSAWLEPSPDRLAQFDARSAAYFARKSGGLVDGIVAADSYCNAAALRCDFVLQPLVLFRRAPSGTEPKIARTYLRQYPGLDLLASRLYREAAGLRTSAQIHNLTAVFDDTPSQFFIDEVHLNEAGNRALVKTLLPIVTAKSPAG